MTTALFLLDATMNALMLALAVRLGGGRIQPVRVLLGAVAGALLAQAAGELSRLQAALVWLPGAALMMRIAAGTTARRHAIENALLLLCAAGLVGGMVLAFFGATGSLALGYALSLIAAFCMCVIRSRRRAQTERIRMICWYRGKTAEFDAMIDSGNTLTDYLTHLPVIVLPEETGRKALDIGDAPLRPIYAQTAGGRQRMSILQPDAVKLECSGRRETVQAMLVFSPQMSANVPALVPAALAGSHWNSNRGG